jgi:hypothetical protein
MSAKRLIGTGKTPETGKEKNWCPKKKPFLWNRNPCANPIDPEEARHKMSKDWLRPGTGHKTGQSDYVYLGSTLAMRRVSPNS